MINKSIYKCTGVYQKLKTRACEMSRKLIRTTSALLTVNLENIYDEKGSPLFYHTAGETITLFRCKPVIVQVRSN